MTAKHDRASIAENLISGPVIIHHDHCTADKTEFISDHQPFDIRGNYF